MVPGVPWTKRLGMRLETLGANKITNNAIDLPLQSINEISMDLVLVHEQLPFP